MHSATPVRLMLLILAAADTSAATKMVDVAGAGSAKETPVSSLPTFALLGP